MNTVIYTAIFGGKERLRPAPTAPPGVSCQCFTDDPRLSGYGWTMHYLQPGGDPRHRARKYKARADVVLTWCDRSIWVDGNMELTRDLSPLFDEFDAPLGVCRHRRRDCVYEEAAFCIKRRKDTPDAIGTTLQWLKSRRHPRHGGLFETGVLLRRHTPEVAAFNRIWWDAIQQGSCRDQLSMPACLDIAQIFPHVFPPDALRQWVKIWPHDSP